MKKSFIIFQIIVTCIIMIFAPPTLITINNKEFNELLRHKTATGFPESTFIIAVLVDEFSGHDCKIYICNGITNYTLERSKNSEIRAYIRQKDNVKKIIIGVDVVLFSSIYVMNKINRNKEKNRKKDMDKENNYKEGTL